MGEEKEKPLTREDVLRLIEAIASREGRHELILNRDCVVMLIEENGGPQNELDLSEMKFERGIDLHDIDLKKITLTKARLVEVHLENADLREAHLEGANLRYAYLEEANLRDAHLTEADLRGARLEKADLRDAHLQGAHLEDAFAEDIHLERAKLIGAHLEKIDLLSAHLEEANLYCADLQRAILCEAHLKRSNLAYAYLNGCDLTNAHLEGARLKGVRLSSETKLQNTRWGSYILAEEIHGPLEDAEDTYRLFKQWYTNAGVYDIAGEFFFREMTAQRKRINWWPHPTQRKRLNWWLHPRHRLWSKFVSLICGYGERPLRVILWAVSWVFGLALVYFLIGSTWQWGALWHSLYFSAVSFTALGYGSWVEITNDWIRGIGAFESFVGVFTIALFLITFVRKMTR